MSELLSRFDLTAVKLNSQIIAALVIVWVAVLACAASSIFGQPFNRRQRIFWLGLITAVPFLGLLAYLPFAFRREDLPHMFHAKSSKDQRRQNRKTRTA